MLSTSDVLFSIYAPPGIDENYIKTDLQKLERIIALSQSSKTELLHVFHLTRQELNTLKV